MLTPKDKDFIIKNNFQLKLIFQKKIDDLILQASSLPRSPERDQLLDTAQGIKIWVKELENLSSPEPLKPDNLI